MFRSRCRLGRERERGDGERQRGRESPRHACAGDCSGRPVLITQVTSIRFRGTAYPAPSSKCSRILKPQVGTERAGTALLTLESTLLSFRLPLSLIQILTLLLRLCGFKLCGPVVHVVSNCHFRLSSERLAKALGS